MSLIERDYMHESYEDKKKAREKRIRESQQKDELWRLYTKKYKTFNDRKRIKDLEYYNLNGEFPVRKKSYSFFVKVLIVLMIIIIIYFVFNLYNAGINIY